MLRDCGAPNLCSGENTEAQRHKDTKKTRINGDFMRVFFVSLCLCASVFSPLLRFGAPQSRSIYHGNWIDLNKNGRMDPYEDPSVPVENRVENLLLQMTLEEK